MNIEPIRFKGKAGQTEKLCPRCHTCKGLDEFWSDPSHWDGLYTYCKTCEVERRRLVREERREANAALEQAGMECAEGARMWDEGVRLLVNAWGKMLLADERMRLNRRAAGTEFDGGRIELRLIHPRAMYVLGLALTEAKCYWPAPLHRTEQVQDSLAAYVGDAPQRDYFDNSSVQEDADGRSEGNNAPERREGASEGRAEQGDGNREEGNSPVRGRKRRQAAGVAG